MDEQRKYAILFAAIILVARKLNDIGSNSCNKGTAGIRGGRCGFPRVSRPWLRRH